MVENDCEDQGYSLIADGCASCRTDEIIEKYGERWLKPVELVKRPIHGKLYWVCPLCGGSYGEVAQELKPDVAP